jgi:hypothetical protein
MPGFTSGAFQVINICVLATKTHSKQILVILARLMANHSFKGKSLRTSWFRLSLPRDGWLMIGLIDCVG